MARTPYGPNTETTASIKALIAGASAFQDWCAEVDEDFPTVGTPEAATAAASRIFIGAIRKTDMRNRPWCLIQHIGKAQTESDSTGTDGYLQRGAVAIEFQRNVPTEYKADGEGALIDFLGWQDDELETSGGADIIMEQVYEEAQDGGAVLIRGFELMDCGYPDEDEEANDGKYLGAYYALHWGLE